jgi:hypothetical protein
LSAVRAAGLVGIARVGIADTTAYDSGTEVPMSKSFRIAMLLVAGLALGQLVGCASASASGGSTHSDLHAAVAAAAAKDCGCGQCAAKGCDPCHGKNCYYCAAKSLVTQDCGCGHCDAKGCACGPGCDVCKFHLAPAAEAKAKGQP